MASNFTVTLEPRQEFGTSGSRRLRRAGKVPVVVYGAGADNEHFTANHDALLHNLDTEAFHSAIIDIAAPGEKRQAILREVQMHPYRAQVLHADFQRVKATEQITIKVPIHFLGDDVAPGVKTQGGIFSRLIIEVEVVCLPKDLPEFIEVDVSHLDMNEAVHLSALALPEGVEFATSLEEIDDYAIASISPARVAAEEEEELEEEEGLIEEGEAAEGGEAGTEEAPADERSEEE